MLVPFVIMLREGLEAALIVGIVASYLHQTGRAALTPAVGVGILLAAAASLFAGAGLQWLAAEFPQKQQELFEAAVGLVAVGALTFMVFWMRRTARALKGELQAGVERALAGRRAPAWALVGVVFLAVAREGLESVFFLLAIFQQSTGAAAPAGALLGVAASALAGWALYRGGIRLDLRRFFHFTGIFILLVAAGLLAGVLRKLHEAGVWNQWQQVVFDLSERLPMDSPLGAVLSGLLGYQAAPVAGEVAVYLAFLAVSLFLFLRGASAPAGQHRRAPA